MLHDVLLTSKQRIAQLIIRHYVPYSENNGSKTKSNSRKGGQCCHPDDGELNLVAASSEEL